MFSARIRTRQTRRALFAAAAVLALLPGAPPVVLGDQPDITSRHPDAPKLDPVTSAVQKDTLTLLRLAAAALADPREQGEALAGVVGAFLKRNRPRDATVDLSIIKDPLWRAQALVYFADFEQREGRTAKARATLGDASSSIDKVAAGRDRTPLLRAISRKQAALRDFEAAIATAKRIPDPSQRIAHFLELGKTQSEVADARISKDAQKTYRAAFNAIKKLEVGRADRARLFLETADALIDAGHSKAARRILDHVYQDIAARPVAAQSVLLARVTAAYVAVGRKDRAMEIVRGLPSDEQRARAFASIARTIARRESVEGAISLFFLAVRDAEAITDTASRYNILQHIIIEQTRAGRLADAFTTAGKIKYPPRQHRALFAMGQTLLENGQGDAALKLVDYLPDIGMRARLFVGVARWRMDHGEKRGAAALARRALDPTGPEPVGDMLARALTEVFELQVDLGRTPGREKVFKRVRTLLGKIPDGPDKVRVLTRLARAEARDKQKDAVERSLGFAWRLAWLARDNADFPGLLHEISTTQLEIGDLLMAFDTAARIPEKYPSDPGKDANRADVRKRPKYSALLSIAVAAARQGLGDLALRAVNKIDHPVARAGAYGAIAMALPVRIQKASKPASTPKRPPSAIGSGVKAEKGG